MFITFTLISKFSEPEYESEILVSQNFKTGRLLYSTISKLNTLAVFKDSIALSKELDIPVKITKHIRGFNVVNSLNQNQIELEYYELLEEKDSLHISLEEYKKYKDLENFPSQRVVIKSNNKNVFTNELSNAIIKIFENNAYYKEERAKRLNEIDTKIKDLGIHLRKSEELQKEYVDILKAYYLSRSNDSDKSTMNLNLNNSKDKIETREYDLLRNQKDIEFQINELESAKSNLQKIARIQKDFNQPIVVKNKYSKYRKFVTLLTFLVFTLIFSFKEFDMKDFINKQGQLNRLKK